MEILKQAHPSPDLYREGWYNLNGEWEFSFDSPVFDRKINVPFTWTCPLSGIHEEDKKGTGYYRRNAEYDCKDNRLFIVFGGVDYECKVFINGTQVGEHFGGYGRFEFEVTDVWNNYKANEITVIATDNDEEYQTYGKQGYGNIRGIWQTVYLEERPKSYIKKFKIQTKINGEVTIDLTADGEFSKVTAEVMGESFEASTGKLQFKINNPQLWDTENPYLYDCTLKLESPFGVDIVKTYFGIREIGSEKIDGKMFITLNKKPIYINAALDQSFNSQGFFTMPTDEYNKEEIERAKSLGLNGIRIHIKTEEKLKLYWADKLGMMVIEDIPCFWGEPTEQAKEYFEKQMYEIIDRDINHPSVIFWVIFNETWGLKTFDKEEEGKWQYEESTQEWVRRLYHDVKKYDPTRPVEDNSPCNRDHVETDINTWHLYINGYENMKKHCKEISETFVCGSTANYINGNKMTDIPVMNSECGNYWGILGNSGDSDISWQYKYMLNEFRLNDKICGFVFTELKDVINEFNGYYRLDDSKKYFGYENYVEQMSINDLHSQNYLGFDYAPMSTKKTGELVSIPLFISAFDNKYFKKQMKVVWETELETGAFGRKTIDKKSMNITYDSYGTTNVGSIDICMPQENGILIVKLYLKDAKDNTVMKNFILFDVTAPIESSYTVTIDELNTDGYKKAVFVQEGNKLNCIDAGKLSFSVDKKKIKNDSAEIVFEISSKEMLTKDRDDNADTSIILDLMRGYRVDRGLNKNSFYMTDDEKFSSNIKVYAADKLIGEFNLSDDPADATGCLSWHYQAVDNRLDEAGSYGYLCKVNIDENTLKDLPEIFDVTICSDNGISIFGRKSGRYPIDIEIL